MQYSANTHEAYLDQLAQDWRKDKLLQVREIILQQEPHLKETMEYKMLAYQLRDKTVFHLNALRAYVSLYVGNISIIEGADELLKDFDKGKGCIRIKKNVSIQDSGLEEFVRKTLAHWASGGETSC
jgi:uncharacterized protein YdhG (YjbR/CyaY superfamily)